MARKDGLRRFVERWRETDRGETRHALDVLAVAFAVVVFARGFEAHAGFAVVMAVLLGAYFRVVSGVVVSEYGDAGRIAGSPG